MIDWYVLQVRSGKEQDAVMELTRNGYSAFAPSRIMLEQKSRAWKEVERLMLPGYVFVALSMNVRAYNAIRGITGVTRFLGAGMPETVPRAEMERMLLLGNGGKPWAVSQGRMEGNSLVVDNGPLKGWESQITETDARRHRAKVAFTVLGEAKTVEIALKVKRSPRVTPDDTSPAQAAGDDIEAISEQPEG